jgi:hypothetical protein
MGGSIGGLAGLNEMQHKPLPPSREYEDNWLDDELDIQPTKKPEDNLYWIKDIQGDQANCFNWKLTGRIIHYILWAIAFLIVLFGY